MSTQQAAPATRRNLFSRALEALLTQRIVLLAVLIVLVLAVMMSLDAAGQLSGSYNADYLASALISAVPLAILGLAQLLVILSGRGGIDLSVGSIVSLTGIFFGLAYGTWGWSFFSSLVLAIIVGGFCGAINGALVSYIGFPPLIATLATYYAFRSLALVISDQKPINSPEIQEFYSAAQSIELPVIGKIPAATALLFDLGVFALVVGSTVLILVALAHQSIRINRLRAIDTAKQEDA